MEITVSFCQAPGPGLPRGLLPGLTVAGFGRRRRPGPDRQSGHRRGAICSREQRGGQQQGRGRLAHFGHDNSGLAEGWRPWKFSTKHSGRVGLDETSHERGLSALYILNLYFTIVL